jgi:glycosyltransferase involved in cell wall biosynthesis
VNQPVSSISTLLSVIVITKNEQNNIGDCLRGVDFAQERVVIDSGSTDQTVQIAKSLGSVVVQFDDWPGFGPQKNRALDVASGQWVLSLDADERVSPALAQEMWSRSRLPSRDSHSFVVCGSAIVAGPLIMCCDFSNAVRHDLAMIWCMKACF